MVTRDRTEELRMHRQSSWGWPHHMQLHRLKSVEDRIHNIHTQVDEIETALDQLKSLVNEITVESSDVLTSCSPDIQQEVNSLNRKRQQVDKMAQDVKEKIRGFGVKRRHSRKARADERVRTNHYISLLNKYTNLVEFYHSSEERFLKRLAQRQERQEANVLGSTTDLRLYDDYCITNEYHPTALVQKQSTSVPPAVLQRVLQEEQQIQGLEERIQEVNVLFRDLKTHVSDQGHIVENIAMSMQRTESYVEEVVTQFKQAKVYQRKSHTTSTIAITVVGTVTVILVVLCVVVVLVKVLT